MRQTRRGCFAAQGGGAKYVWKIYDLAYGADINAAETASSTFRDEFAVSKSYTATATTFTLVNPAEVELADIVAGDYFMNGSYFCQVISTTPDGRRVRITYYRWLTPTLCLQGADTGMTVESTDINAYPANGIQGDYWYVLQS